MEARDLENQIHTKNHQPEIDKIYLYAKDLFGAKYQLLLNRSGGAALRHLDNSKSSIE